jgi:hypothetical protein
MNNTTKVLYIFKGERIRDDYIQLYKLRACMAMQSKTWMTTYLFGEFLSFLGGQYWVEYPQQIGICSSWMGMDPMSPLKQLNKLNNLGWIWLLYLRIHHMPINLWMWLASNLLILLLKGKETQQCLIGITLNRIK